MSLTSSLAYVAWITEDYRLPLGLSSCPHLIWFQVELGASELTAGFLQSILSQIFAAPRSADQRLDLELLVPRVKLAAMTAWDQVISAYSSNELSRTAIYTRDERGKDHETFADKRGRGLTSDEKEVVRMAMPNVPQLYL